MSLNDIDSGWLILLAGVALQKSAQFVTIRINQLTAGHKQKVFPLNAALNQDRDGFPR